jgi:hypothetical protein
LSKAFSAAIEMIMWFLSLLLLICYLIFNVESSLHPWDETNLVMVYDFLKYCWIWFTRMLLRMFAHKLIKEIGL